MSRPDASLSADNVGFAEEMLAKFLEEPSKLPPAWQRYFADLLEPAAAAADGRDKLAAGRAAHEASGPAAPDGCTPPSAAPDGRSMSPITQSRLTGDGDSDGNPAAVGTPTAVPVTPPGLPPKPAGPNGSRTNRG